MSLRKVLSANEQKIFLFVSAVIALSIPFKASINSVLCILLASYWLLFMGKKFLEVNVKMIVWISVLFWLAVVGMIYTKNIDEGLFRFQQKALLILFPLVYGVVTVDWQKSIKVIYSFFIWGVVSACFISLLTASYKYYLSGSSKYFFSHALVESAFVDLYTYILAILCLASIILLAEHLIQKSVLPNVFTKKLTVFLIIFLIAFVVLLGVKQLIAALFVFLIVYAIRLNKKIIYLSLIVGTLTVTLAIYFFPVLKQRMSEAFQEFRKDNPLNNHPEHGYALNGVALRRALWVCAWDVVKDHPFIGVGSGDGQDELQQAYENRTFIFAAKYNRFNAHNQYIQIAVNFGFIGLAIWLYSAYSMIRIKKGDWIFLSFLSLLLFSMFTESLLETNKGTLTFAFLLTMAGFSKAGEGIASQSKK